MFWHIAALILHRNYQQTTMARLIIDAFTNTCYFSRLLLERPGGENILKRIIGSGVDVKLLQGTRDIWCRDYMPIQIYGNRYIGYEYTPDYLDNPRDAAYQTNPARVLDRLGIDITPSGLIIDGGNVIKTNRGIIMVDKVFHENSHLKKEMIVSRLEKYFDCEIIFLPWDRAEKYGHADGIVRYIGNGRVLLTNYHQYDKDYARQFENILAKYFDVEVLDFNVSKPCKHNWCYINFLRVGRKIFLPQLTWENYSEPCEAACPPEGNKTNTKPKWYHSHIEEDDSALEQFQRLFPNCEIIPVSCPQIVEDGGALNCISWNIRHEK